MDNHNRPRTEGTRYIKKEEFYFEQAIKVDVMYFENKRVPCIAISPHRNTLSHITPTTNYYADRRHYHPKSCIAIPDTFHKCLLMPSAILLQNPMTDSHWLAVEFPTPFLQSAEMDEIIMVQVPIP